MGELGGTNHSGGEATAALLLSEMLLVFRFIHCKSSFFFLN